MKRFGIGLLLGVLGCVLLLEGVLHLTPVNSGLRMESTSEGKPYSRYLPNQEYVYSFGWAMNNVQRGSTNDLGFTNSLTTPLPGGTLVIGDSYIESLMLCYEETVQGRLEASYRNQVSAVSASGNGLADSLRITESFLPTVQPRTIVFFVEPSDVSLLLDPAEAGHNGFVVNGTTISIVHKPYIESPYKALITSSALIRYIYYNLKLQKWLSSVFRSKSTTPEALETTLVHKKEALEYYFSRIADLGAANGFKAIFLVDGNRKNIYANDDNDGVGWLESDRKLFMLLATKYGHEIVNMEPIFERHWRVSGQRLDWLPMDGHWNPVAHLLAAEQVSARIRR